ncbi:MAG: hypothetical protein M1833_006064 [Piccolia ochrophora]|nr:MAG: hypothetical protein M1833_006064 [Piccolia ochrophora]
MEHILDASLHRRPVYIDQVSEEYFDQLSPTIRYFVAQQFVQSWKEVLETEARRKSSEAEDTYWVETFRNAILDIHDAQERYLRALYSSGSMEEMLAARRRRRSDQLEARTQLAYAKQQYEQCEVHMEGARELWEDATTVAEEMKRTLTRGRNSQALQPTIADETSGMSQSITTRQLSTSQGHQQTNTSGEAKGTKHNTKSGRKRKLFARKPGHATSTHQPWARVLTWIKSVSHLATRLKSMPTFPPTEPEPDVKQLEERYRMAVQKVDERKQEFEGAFLNFSGYFLPVNDVRENLRGAIEWRRNMLPGVRP